MHEKKGIFRCTESVAMTPKSRDHMPTTSLWGVAAKWPTRAPKTKRILCPRDPQGYSRISLSLSGRILKEYRNIVSTSKQTPCGIPWGLRNRTHWSARYTNGHDAVQQESQLTFLSTTCIHSLLKNLRWQPHWLPRLTSLPGKSRDWWRTRDCSLGQPTENKID